MRALLNLFVSLALPTIQKQQDGVHDAAARSSHATTSDDGSITRHGPTSTCSNALLAVWSANAFTRSIWRLSAESISVSPFQSIRQVTESAFCSRYEEIMRHDSRGRAYWDRKTYHDDVSMTATNGNKTDLSAI